VLRDVPEPAVLGAGLDDERRALIAPDIALRPFPIRPDRSFVEDRIPHPQVQTVHQQTVLTAGVDNHFGVHVSQRAISAFDPDADRAIAVEQHLVDAHALVHRDAVLARVVQHHLVELAAHHLPRLRALVRFVVPEVERRRLLAR
jgi:hypothetical protein